jgi:HrpA-like RNA helicase
VRPRTAGQARYVIDSGLARVKRYRPEKPAREADTLQTVRAIFERQRA